MSRRVLLLVLPLFLLAASCVRREAALTRERESLPLSAWATDPSPWLDIPANSEQRHPVYLGSTPREIVLGLKAEDGGREHLPEALRYAAEAFLSRLEESLRASARLEDGEEMEVEAWPTRDDDGILTWVYGRWRVEGRGPWDWLGDMESPTVAVGPVPFLPISLRRDDEKEFDRIFSDFLSFKDLYAKPAFGDCVWTENGKDSGSAGITAAWLPMERLPAERDATDSPNRICRVVPQPARVNGKPKTYVIGIRGGRIRWPGDIAWRPASEGIDGRHRVAAGRPIAWPGDFVDRYKEDVQVLAGEKEAHYPLSGRRATFSTKNSADVGNRLMEVADYLEERYRSQGIATFRQEFSWRGIRQANLVAVIPGKEPKGRNRPVLLADHIDTAYCEDIFRGTGERVSAPGADDDASATAALLRAAEILKDSRPRHDIWLVHLTGEEFPADSLGARRFAAYLLRERRDIGGLVLMDLIGHRAAGDAVFQVNAGESPGSQVLAGIAMEAALTHAHPAFIPVLRARHDPRSYLYNTDGLVFSDLGFPVVLLNEHMNAKENIDRPGYHDSRDGSALMDWEFATAIAKTAIATVSGLAGKSD
jgi:hypothetical protein